MKKLIIFLVLLLSVLYAAYAFSGISISGGAVGGSGAAASPRVVVADGDTDPGVDDDVDTATGAATPVVSGYIPGDIWINDTADPTKIFVCVTNADGAAVWQELTQDLTSLLTAFLDSTSGADLVDAPGIFADGDTTPDVSSGAVFITANTGATVISDFDTELTNGKVIFVIANDANTGLDFTASGLEGAALDFTLVDGEVAMFIYATADSKWHYNGFPKAFTQATSGLTASTILTANVSGVMVSNAAIGLITHNGRLKTPTPQIATPSSFTMGGDGLYGGVYIGTGDTTANLPAIGTNHYNFTVKARGATTPTLEPNGTDAIFLNGTSCGDGVNIVGSGTAGDMVVMEYGGADGDWEATGNGFSCGV